MEIFFELRHSEMKAFVSNLVCFPVRSVFSLFCLAYICVSSMLRKWGLPKVAVAWLHELDRLLQFIRARLCPRIVSGTLEVQGGPEFWHRCRLVSAVATFYFVESLFRRAD